MDRGAALHIQVFQFGDPPHRKRIEGRDVKTVIEEGKEFLESIGRKYE